MYSFVCVMSRMFFSFVLDVSQCTLMWKNGYAERQEFTQKIKNQSKINIPGYLWWCGFYCTTQTIRHHNKFN